MTPFDEAIRSLQHKARYLEGVLETLEKKEKVKGDESVVESQRIQRRFERRGAVTKYSFVMAKEQQTERPKLALTDEKEEEEDFSDLSESDSSDTSSSTEDSFAEHESSDEEDITESHEEEVSKQPQMAASLTRRSLHRRCSVTKFNLKDVATLNNDDESEQEDDNADPGRSLFLARVPCRKSLQHRFSATKFNLEPTNSFRSIRVAQHNKSARAA